MAVFSKIREADGATLAGRLKGVVLPSWWSWSWDGVEREIFVEELRADCKWMDTVIDLMFERSSAWKRGVDIWESEGRRFK